MITSPAQSHPSTEIIWQTLNSLELISGLENAPITVVADGCRRVSSLEPEYAGRLAARLDAHPCRFSKRGIVTDAVAEAYEEYKERLAHEVASSLPGRAVDLLELEYGGFAMAVKAGLQSVIASGAKYALVVQHDRAFCHSLAHSDLEGIYDHLEKQPGCRYVGFPSGTSKLLAAKTSTVYQLHKLLASRTRQLRPSIRLVPCIHWLDSNHIVDAQRALEMYQPYSHAPARLMRRLGGAGLNRFRLRHGDFIEERFGVEQRNLLASTRDEPDECLELFDWFGSYMLMHSLPTSLSHALSSSIGSDRTCSCTPFLPPLAMPWALRLVRIVHAHALPSYLPSHAILV